MGFRQTLVAGTDLVREAIRSPGFISGVFGWTINRDGTAEFSSAAFRGSLTVGTAPAPQIVIVATGNPGQPFILFYTHGANETAPAQIHAGSGAGGDYGLEIDSNEYSSGGQISTIWWSPSGVNSLYPTKTGGIVQTAHFNAASGQPGTFVLDNDIGLFITSAGAGISAMALANGNYPLQIGPNSAQNLRMNFQQIQAVNNGAAASLFLQNLGGVINLGPTTGQNIQIDPSIRNIQALSNGTATSLLLNNSGGQVFVGAGLTVVGSYNSTSGSITLTNGSLNVSGGIINTAGNFTAGSGCVIGGGVTTSAGSQMGSALILAGTDVNVTGAPNNTAGTAANWVNTSGTNWRITRNTSSRRFKEQIRDLENFTVEQILKLRPRTFKRNDQMRDLPVPSTTGQAEDEYMTVPIPVEESPWFAGFIAEEADELGLTTWVVRTAQGVVESFNYAEFAAVAHQYVLQEHQAKIAALEARIAQLESR